MILRSSTGSVGWWDDMALLQGKLPFLPSASALFLQSNSHTRRFHLHDTEKYQCTKTVLQSEERLVPHGCLGSLNKTDAIVRVQLHMERWREVLDVPSSTLNGAKAGYEHSEVPLEAICSITKVIFKTFDNRGTLTILALLKWVQWNFLFCCFITLSPTCELKPSLTFPVKK